MSSSDSDNNNFKDRWRRTPEIDDDRIELKLSPEQVCWLTVLDKAIEDTKIFPRSGKFRDKDKRDLRRAREWFVSQSTEVSSFFWVCEQLDFNPNDVLRIVSVSQYKVD